MLISRLLTGLTACLLTFTAPVDAQNLFAPVFRINEDVITEYEVQQRQRFFSVVSPATSSRDRVEEELVAEKLRNQAVRRAGLTPTPEDIEQGMELMAEALKG